VRITRLHVLPRCGHIERSGGTPRARRTLERRPFAIFRPVRRTYSTTNIRADGQVILVPFTDGITFEVVPGFINQDKTSYTFPNANRHRSRLCIASRSSPRSISTPSILATFRPSSRNTSNAAHERGLTEVGLIHGRGKGVQRGIVQAALEGHPLVVSFYDAPESHVGATVAILKGSGLAS
jgi:hypothetical protein